MSRLTILVTLTACLALAACGEPSEELKQIGKKAGETWDAVKTWSYQQKDQLQAWGRQSLDEMKPLLETAKQKAAEAGSSASEALSAGWDDVQEKFAALENASADEWEKTRDAFVAAYEAFREKIAE